MNKKWVGSPNFSQGRAFKIDGVVVHWIVGTLSTADATFQNPSRQASAHYGIGGSEIHQYVKEEDTAWHSGNWTVNQKTIGIEHEGGLDIPISDETYKTSAALIKEICARYGIKPSLETITPHKKWLATQCPGTLNIQKILNIINQGDIKKYMYDPQVTVEAIKDNTLRQVPTDGANPVESKNGLGSLMPKGWQGEIKKVQGDWILINLGDKQEGWSETSNFKAVYNSYWEKQAKKAETTAQKALNDLGSSVLENKELKEKLDKCVAGTTSEIELSLQKIILWIKNLIKRDNNGK